MIIENFDDEKKRTSDKSRCSPNIRYYTIPHLLQSNSGTGMPCPNSES